MFENIEIGDTATVSYSSKRSGNTVSRAGEVLQVPGEKDGFFIQSERNKLTCVFKGHVFSMTIDTDAQERSVERQTHLGTVESVSAE